MLHRTPYLILLLIMLSSCVNTKIQESDIPFFDFYMEYDATNKPENTLLLRSDSSEFYFAISAVNVNSELALDTVLPMAEKTHFTYDEEGEYTITVRVFLPDGTFYHEKTLTWVYDATIPMAPIIGFSEKATNDEFVNLLISGNISENISEIWIEGDLASSMNPEGSWLKIPSIKLIPIIVSDGDGFKKFNVKTRSKAMVESEVLNLSILRKDKLPESCASFIPSITKSRFVNFEVTATDTQQLYYRVFGDANNDTQFHKFSGNFQVPLELTDGFGVKAVTIQIRDDAENYCLKDEYEIVYDPDYKPGTLTIKGEPIWTEDPNILVKVHQDHLPSDEMEIFIFGGILSTENTDQWIPYTSGDIAVTLSPRDGHRWVRAKFRKNGIELPAVWDGIYLKPHIYARNVMGTIYLSLSNIVELETMTITGCSESYTKITYATNLICTSTGSTIDVEYFLKDGSTVKRSAPVP